MPSTVLIGAQWGDGAAKSPTFRANTNGGTGQDADGRRASRCMPAGHVSMRFRSPLIPGLKMAAAASGHATHVIMPSSTGAKRLGEVNGRGITDVAARAFASRSWSGAFRRTPSSRRFTACTLTVEEICVPYARAVCARRALNEAWAMGSPFFQSGHAARHRPRHERPIVLRGRSCHGAGKSSIADWASRRPTSRAWARAFPRRSSPRTAAKAENTRAAVQSK